jgi:hypothetical protein
LIAAHGGFFLCGGAMAMWTVVLLGSTSSIVVAKSLQNVWTTNIRDVSC